MSEGFKEHVQIEKFEAINRTVLKTMQDSYERWCDQLSEYERTNVEGELDRLESDTSQSFGIYSYLRGLANSENRPLDYPVTEVYRQYINEVTDIISETVTEEELGMRARLLQHV